VAANEIATIAELIALVEDAAGVGPRAVGTVTIGGTVPATSTLKLGALTLTSVAVARTPGANNFNGSGTTTAIAADIAAAISDSQNAWAAGGVTASASGAVVSLIGNRGSAGDVALVSSDASMVVDGMSGGDAWIVHALGFADAFLDASCWGAFRNMASIYVAAHFLTQVPGGLASGASGSTTSVNIGAISKSFAVATPTDSRFGSSSWGRLYLSLAENILCAPGIVGAGGTPLGLVC